MTSATRMILSVLSLRNRYKIVLLCVTVIAVYAVVKNEIDYRSQKSAVALLDQLTPGGVIVDYDFDVSGDRLTLPDRWRNRIRREMAKLLGRGRLGVVVAVTPRKLVALPTDNTVIPDMSSLRMLRRLYVRAPFTDEDSPHLAAFVGIERLSLALPGVTDASLIHVSRLPRLLYLDLSGTSVTSSGLGLLSKRRSIESLVLAATAVDDQCGMTLSQLPSLKSLDLSSTAVSDDIVPIIASIRTLEWVDLTATKVTKGGLASLAAIRPTLTIEPESDNLDDDYGIANEK